LAISSCKIATECAGEKHLKIGQYSAKIWTKVCGLLIEPPCTWIRLMQNMGLL